MDDNSLDRPAYGQISARRQEVEQIVRGIMSSFSISGEGVTGRAFNWNIDLQSPRGSTPSTGGKASSAVLLPFQIITQPKPATPGIWQFGVIFNSSLYSNANVTSPPTIPTQAIASGANGLLTSATPTTTDAGWVTWSGSNDNVWLEVVFGTWPAISTVQIQSLSNGGSYGGGDVENDGGMGTPTVSTQTKCRVLIGTLTAPVSPLTRPIVKQICNRNLKLYPTWMDSFSSSGGNETVIAAIYPFICQA